MQREARRTGGATEPKPTVLPSVDRPEVSNDVKNQIYSAIVTTGNKLSSKEAYKARWQASRDC